MVYNFKTQVCLGLRNAAYVIGNIEAQKGVQARCVTYSY